MHFYSLAVAKMCVRAAINKAKIIIPLLLIYIRIYKTIEE